jgi:2-keto-4-pentenoate hydratase/2-oxohepta-3-ene-1,7-dioic acid hydratase in catechol pathway
VLFAKFANTVCGHREPVRKPPITTKLDFEGELGVVIGTGGKGIPKERALACVFGYTVINDVTARDIQKSDGQWLRAKGQDGFAPMGPCIATTAGIPDPQNLGIRTAVNGKVMQESNTNRMIFGVADIVAFITQGITLEPGDIISTGTPSGVGVWRNPPSFLEAGDVIEIEIEKIGKLVNPVTA